MEKKIASLLGAVAALGTLGAAQASPPPSPSDALKANSYADLLEPIPNAGKILQALDEQAPAKSADAGVKVAQIVVVRPHHHHHHHHHHGYRRFVPVPRVVVVPRRRHHHHHHHHHHHMYRY